MRRHVIAVVVGIVGALWVSVAAAQVTAIRAGRVVDPDAGTSAINQIILVEAGRIKAIGAGLAIPPGATVIDLSASTISPGLVDAHAQACSTSCSGRRGR